MHEHDQRRRPRHQLQVEVNGTLRLPEHIESWELELVQKALAKPAAPAASETRDGE